MKEKERWKKQEELNRREKRSCRECSPAVRVCDLYTVVIVDDGFIATRWRVLEGLVSFRERTHGPCFAEEREPREYKAARDV